MQVSSQVGGFYPRLREGGDQPAPPSRRPLKSFYPRLREGGDSSTSCMASRKWSCFYPRLREGGDLNGSSQMATFARFYPRLREGGDIWPSAISNLGITVSTHASAREATVYDLPNAIDTGVSTHASAREATSAIACNDAPLQCFYPRLREGGDGLSAQFAVRVIGFLPTPPRGRRLR